MAHSTNSFTLKHLIAGIGLALATASTQASSAFFTDEAAFNSAAASHGPRQLETYEASALGSTPTSLDWGAFTFSCEGGTYCSSFFGRWSTLTSEGNHAIFGATPDVLVFKFNTPIHLFATDLIGFADLGPTTLHVGLSNGDSADLFPGLHQPDGTVRFVGFISPTAFDTISFSGMQIGDGMAFDRTQFTTAVPEPSAALLALTGAGLLLLRKHRPKRPPQSR